MSAMVNPYIATEPVGGTVSFVGRERELTELRQAVLSQPVVVISGGPGSGRSSLLMEISRQMFDQSYAHPVLLDLKHRAWDPLDTVVAYIADQVGRTLTITSPELGQWAENRFSEQWLPNVLDRIAPDERLVLLIDGFPLVYDPRSRQAAGALLPWLAGIMEQWSERLTVVFVTDSRFLEHEAVVRRYFPGVVKVELGPLAIPDAWSLVRMSHLDRSLRWTNDAVERTLTLTGAHPQLTQHLCHLVWTTAHNASPPIAEVTAVSVDQESQALLEEAGSWFAALWQGLGAASRIVAAVLSWHDGIAPDTHRLPTLLHARGVRVVTRVLEHDGPKELRRQHVLTPNPAHLAFAVPLFQLWIRTHHPLQDVLQELDHIDPMAERSFADAERMWRTATQESARQAALVQLEEVLDLNPNHAAATELLSIIHERRGDAVRATQLAERLYDAQPERARDRLVRLLMDQATKESNAPAKVALYDRVLAIAPDHADAQRERRGCLPPPAQSAQAGPQAIASAAAPTPLTMPSAANGPSPTALDKPPAARPAATAPRPRGTLPGFVPAVETLHLTHSGATSPDWSESTAESDNERFARLYERAETALREGRKDEAMRILGRLAADRPTYRDTVRLLYRSVHDVDPAKAHEPMVPRRNFVTMSALAVALFTALVATHVQNARTGLVAHQSALRAAPANAPANAPAAPSAQPPAEVAPPVTPAATEAPSGTSEAPSGTPEAPSGAPEAPSSTPEAPSGTAGAPSATPEAPSDAASSTRRPTSGSLEREGWAKIDAGDWTAAEGLFDRAVTRNPRSPSAHYGLAYSAEKLGAIDTAFIHYCAARSLSTETSDVRRDVDGRLLALGKRCD